MPKLCLRVGMLSGVEHYCRENKCDWSTC